jgi:hypothetical protein
LPRSNLPGNHSTNEPLESQGTELERSSSVFQALKRPEFVLAYVLFGGAGVACGRGIPPEYAFPSAAFMYLVAMAATLVPPILAYRQRARQTDRYYDLEEKKLQERQRRRKQKVRREPAERGS